MIDFILKKIFGTKHERDVKGLLPRVAAINALEPELQHLDDAALRAKTDELRSRLEDEAEVDELLEEAFAVCREAARRTLGMRHFDVQLMGGKTPPGGNTAEGGTREGRA